MLLCTFGTSLISIEFNSAISAWNDNGQKRFVKDEKYLYRSDFFPGLGWMMPRYFISDNFFLLLVIMVLVR
jgi:hypothetical protein